MSLYVLLKNFACDTDQMCMPLILFVTGPAKIGHVGTRYIVSHNVLYFSSGLQHLISVTCIIKPDKL